MRDFLRRLFVPPEPRTVTVTAIDVTSSLGVVGLTVYRDDGQAFSCLMTAAQADQLSMSLYRQAANATIQAEMTK